MSRQFRHRVTAVVLGGLLLGTPLLMNGTASAGQVEGAGRQVVFGSGEMLGISCHSAPNVESMTVPAASTVLVVNRTGHDARLLLGGTEKGTLKDDSATQVVFRRGTTAVALDPNCSLGDDAMPAMVTATPSMPATPALIPTNHATSTPADDTSSDSEPLSDDDPPGPAPDATTAPQQVTTSHSDGARPNARPHAERPAAVRPGASRSGAGLGAVATATTAPIAPGSASSKAKVRAGERTAGTVAPELNGLPPGADQALVPGVPELEVPPATESAPAAPSASTSQIAAAEPVAAMQSLPPERPIGLLALIASVCAVGVGIAAIRAFAAQRAFRARIA